MRIRIATQAHAIVHSTIVPRERAAGGPAIGPSCSAPARREAMAGRYRHGCESSRDPLAEIVVRESGSAQKDPPRLPERASHRTLQPFGLQNGCRPKGEG